MEWFIAKMGRPPIEVDWHKIDMYCSYKMSLEDVAFLCGCTMETIEQKIKKQWECTFLEYRAKKVVALKVKLIQKALEMAEAGDRTMLIFSLKNLCKWCDNPNLGYTPTEDK